MIQPSFVLFGFHLHEPSAEPGWKPGVGTLEKQVPLLPLYHYSITVAGHIGNGICRAKVPNLFNRICPAIASCDLPGLHIASRVKIRVHLHIDFFRFAAAVPIHSSQLLCKNYNYLSYYNKSLRCFQDDAAISSVIQTTKKSDSIQTKTLSLFFLFAVPARSSTFNLRTERTHSLDQLSKVNSTCG